MRILCSVALTALAFGLSVPAFAQQDIPATADGAKQFVDSAETQLGTLSLTQQRADWINETYITDDTDALAADERTKYIELQVNLALDAAKYAEVPGLDPVVARKLTKLRTTMVLPAPTTPGAAQELSNLSIGIQSEYGKGHGTLDGKPISGSDIEAEMGNLSHTPAEFSEMWSSWHDQVGAPMKDDYVKMVGIANDGAKELGFPDVGALWRSNYDMPPDQFAAMTDRIWDDLKPLYQSLHTYVRWKLNEKYGDAVQAKTGPIRADLLGNMWAQEWGNIYPLVAPAGAGDIGYDIGDLLREHGKTPLDMVHAGENFYSSLGFEKLPDTFWKRSQFLKPADREVVCHASAWDLDNKDDLRVKMCIKVDSDDFVTIHHELGHNYYQRAYKDHSFLQLDGANDGFHEAIGDFIALSITPDYLVQIGLLDRKDVPSADKDIGLLLRQALDKVAFLPFGLLVDKWRWGVFDGSITPEHYNDAWVKLKRDYQGIVPPVERPANAFDPGAKFHIPGNTPYMRYFLARILQFQFYEAACKQAGWKGPLHRCSFYGNEEVGKNLNAMLAMGASKPWPDALQAFTGTREISGKAMADYFAPLKKWLDQQNKGKPAGW
ncbi:MAG: M2 family metallopeptidase [Candidatus Andeanibacterium colombiense]|uniref:M2 family metallopeptidase n=1 Tax=Candidatus Andeanibacterium colombiense TaxID=3121345 RepID=A0AAJ6BQ97_9SPHN|nr:MAG: M2 family metallopeptidase [Sphingomonadaceae bacterium]